MIILYSYNHYHHQYHHNHYHKENICSTKWYRFFGTTGTRLIGRNNIKFQFVGLVSFFFIILITFSSISSLPIVLAFSIYPINNYATRHLLCIQNIQTTTSIYIKSINNIYHPKSKSRIIRLTMTNDRKNSNTNTNTNTNDNENDPLLQTSTKNSNTDNNDTDNNNTNTKNIGKEILDLAIPAGAALLIDPVMTVIDTIFVGRYYTPPTSTSFDVSSTNAIMIDGSSPLAGMGSASSLLVFCFYLCNFLCTATTPLIAQQRAKYKMSIMNSTNNTNQTTTTKQQYQQLAIQTSGQVLSLAIGIGIVLIIVLSLFGSSILYNIMGTSYTGIDATTYANKFLSIRLWAAPAVLLIDASVGILRGFLDTKTSIIILIVANIINFILDILLILYPFNLGPTGAAIATTTAEWISAGLFLGILAGYLPSASTTKEIGSNQRILLIPPPIVEQQQQQTQQQLSSSSSSSSSTNDSNYGSISINDNDNVSSRMQQNNNYFLQHQKRPEGFISIVPLKSIPSFTEVRPLLVASTSIFFRSLILQLSLSAAAAIAARSGAGSTSTVSTGSIVNDITTTVTALTSSSKTTSSSSSSSSSMASHQIAIQLWLLCSFFCDSLAAASQGLIADAIGQNNQQRVRDITKIIFLYSIYLGLFLAILLQVLYVSNNNIFLVELFTKDIATQKVLSSIIPLIIIAQPLNSLVFTADGILQGGSQFTYQAQAMALSGVVAAITFIALDHNIISLPNFVIASSDSTSITLVHAWVSLLVLQLMRGITSLYKLIDASGPINILNRKVVS